MLKAKRCKIGAGLTFSLNIGMVGYSIVASILTRMLRFSHSDAPGQSEVSSFLKAEPHASVSSCSDSFVVLLEIVAGEYAAANGSISHHRDV